jgi:hypothetical protein
MAFSMASSHGAASEWCDGEYVMRVERMDGAGTASVVDCKIAEIRP